MHALGILIRDESGTYLVKGFTILPRAVWEKWLEQNRDGDLVKNRVIFETTSPQDPGPAAA